jgi:hypothetical protein
VFRAIAVELPGDTLPHRGHVRWYQLWQMVHALVRGRLPGTALATSVGDDPRRAMMTLGVFSERITSEVDGISIYPSRSVD